MKRILYISNIEVPYRAEFFTRLSERCDLTVVYEGSNEERDSTWASSGNSEYRKIFIDRKSRFIGKLRELLTMAGKDWDLVIIGCYSTPLQILTAKYLKITGRKYVVNLDGEAFISKGFKSMVKRFVLRGADGYLTAGKHSAESLREAI